MVPVGADHVTTPAIRVVSGALVRDGRLLVGRRPDGRDYAGHWETPGGKVEPGETDEAAIVRELWEELNVNALVSGYLGEVPFGPPEFPRSLDFLMYRVEASGEPCRLVHDELRWVTLAELGRLQLAPGNAALYHVLRGLLEG
jgi:8-oxo-dGTP diphosphatase